MTEPTHRLEIKIDLAGIYNRSVRDVRRIVHFTAAALSVQPSGSVEPELPVGAIAYRFNPPEGVDDVPLLNAEYPAWVLASGFRDLAEVVTGLLEEAFTVRWYWKRVGVPGRLVLELREFEQMLADAKSDFNRRTLPDKFSELKADGIEIDEKLVSFARSVYAVRNCLVHRAGIVCERDLDSTGKLTLVWMKGAMEVAGPNGERREVALPYTKNADEQLYATFMWSERPFELGERVDLSTDTFAAVGITMTLLANAIIEGLLRCAGDLGLNVRIKGDARSEPG